MTAILIIVFLGAFGFVTLVMSASGTGATMQTKKVIHALNSALASSVHTSSDEMVDLRKNELVECGALDQPDTRQHQGCTPAAYAAVSSQYQVDRRRIDHDDDGRVCNPGLRGLSV